jgi:hypothetical protein
MLPARSHTHLDDPGGGASPIIIIITSREKRAEE